MSRASRAGGIPENIFQCVRLGPSQKLAFDSSSKQCVSGFAAQNTIVQVFATEDCFISIGENPVASTDGSSAFLAAGFYMYYNAPAGEKIAAIAADPATPGVLYITEGGA